MEVLSITGTLRGTGKKDAKAVRSQGNVPCVIYGVRPQPIHFSTHRLNFREIVYTPNVKFVDIHIDNQTMRTILKEVQFHPVTNEIIHADFLEISENKKITMEIPVSFTGRSVGVSKGGKLLPKMRKLKIKALPKDMPSTINIDITDLDVGKSIRIGDIKAENIEILHNKSIPVVSVIATRAMISAATTAAKK
ncbi:MAG: 50S ribosomal protein L25/general stress protein Ctc [Bacteroidia bacterium]|nr:50S ribosomal protein L25/general stress protein Ctc [Bacteroidia bacterium]MDW8346069.1 50S ribosomal protein L25/general stress protein Ctc [Bacteroidia bacterium]